MELDGRMIARDRESEEAKEKKGGGRRTGREVARSPTFYKKGRKYATTWNWINRQTILRVEDSVFESILLGSL